MSASNNRLKAAEVYDTTRRHCRCPEPFGDIREGTCQLCGHQAPGMPIPTPRTFGQAFVDRSTFASKKPRYGARPD